MINNHYNRGFLYNRTQIVTKYTILLLSKLTNSYLYSLMIKGYTGFAFTQKVNLFTFFTFCKNSSLLNMQTLTDIVVVDNPHSHYSRFAINYHLLSYNYNKRFIIKTYTNPLMPLLSVTQLWGSANWLEREAWDMFGVKFLLHPDLRRILTDYGFQGHPLRKDFPLIGFVEVRYEDNIKSVIVEPVELTQDYRIYKFTNSWANWK